MMAMKSALRSISGAFALLALATTPAVAGNMGHSPCSAGGYCDAGVTFVPTPKVRTSTTTVENRTPYDFMDSVHFKRDPHVSITRIHGLDTTVKLSDSPVGFTGGCHPQSTIYCRSGHVGTATPPVVKPPIIPRPALPKPIVHHPVVQHPVRPPRVVAIGGGYDPSKFTPRVYGDPYTIVPGIAHLPTSIVDRDPYRAQALLDSGRAAPNPLTPGGVTPAFVGVPVRPPVPNVYPPVWHPRPPVIGGPVFHPRPPVVHPRPQPPVTCRQPLPRPPVTGWPHPRPVSPCGGGRY